MIKKSHAASSERAWENIFVEESKQIPIIIDIENKMHPPPKKVACSQSYPVIILDDTQITGTNINIQ